MPIIITSVPRPSGVGQYVRDIMSLPNTQVFYHKVMDLTEYEQTNFSATSRFGQYREVLSDALFFTRLKVSPQLHEKSHISSEGFGPIFGRKTKLITVHQVIKQSDHPPNSTINSVRKRSLINANKKTAKLGIDVAVPSIATGDEFIRYYGADPGKIHIIPNAVRTDIYKKVPKESARNALDLQSEAFYILSVGSDDYRKNTPIIHKVFREARNYIPSIHWIHLGKSAYVRDLVRGGVETDITILDSLDSKQMPLLYNAVDALVFPSIIEGCSYTLLEALSSELPVVVSDISSIREIMGEYFTGGHESDVGHHLMNLRNIYRSYGGYEAKGLRRRIEKEYSLTRFKERFSELYKEVGLS